jgi:predicted Zn-dependent protease
MAMAQTLASSPKVVVVKASRQAALVASLCLLQATVGAGQQLDEYTRAAASRNYYIQRFGIVEGTEANVIGQSVFSDLTRSISISYGAKPYEMTILADPSVNAGSVGAGKVFVNLGLVL